MLSLQSSDNIAVSSGPSQYLSTTSNKQMLISTIITKMIVTDLLPLWTIEGTGFQELVHLIDPNYSVITPQQLQHNVLPSYVKIVQENIRMALKQMDAFVLSIDICNVNPLQSYVGFSVSYLTPLWESKTLLLACSSMIGQEGFQNVPLLIQQMLKAYSINDLSYNILVNKQIIHSNNGLLGNQYNDTDNDEMGIELDSLYPKAFSFLLSLSIYEGLLNGLPTYQTALDEATRVVTEIKKCPNMTEVVFGRDLDMLKTDIHWILHLQLIRCILKYVPKDETNTLLLADEYRIILTEITAILELFEEAVNIMQRNEPISLCLPSLVSLKTHLDIRSTGVCSSLAISLYSALERNFQDLKTNSLYVCSAILDPRFKLSWCKCDNEIDNYKKIILEEAQKIFDTTSKSETISNNNPTNLHLSQSKLFSVISFHSSQSSSKCPNLELTNYLKEDGCEDDPIAYWKIRSSIYPTLGKLAKRILCAKHTPSPINRVFQYAANNIHTDSCSWLPEHYEMLLFLKASMSEFHFL